MFSEDARLIYEFHNGEKKVKADPIRLLQRIMAGYAESDMETDMKLMTLQNAESITAFMRLAKFAKQVFAMKDIEDDGVTDAEAILELTKFSNWAEEVQSRFFISPTSLTPTVPTSSSGAESRPATRFSSPSTSTELAASIASASPSVSV